MNNKDKKIKISELKKELSKTVDNLERAVIIGKIEKIESELKESKNNMKVNSVTEAPVVMDRKIKAKESFNGHTLTKSVNGVYQKESTVIYW